MIKITTGLDLAVDTSGGTTQYSWWVNGKSYPITIQEAQGEYGASVKISEWTTFGRGDTKEEAIKDLENGLMIDVWDRDNISKIPKGHYCYSVDKNGKQVNCPFWGINHSKEEMRNGYCNHLGKGDWEETPPWGFLWDQVKCCGINIDNTEK